MTRVLPPIDRAELRLVRLALINPFTISTGTMVDKVFPLLTLSAGGIEGYAEGVMDPLPDFLEETIAGTMALLGDTILPGIVGRSFDNPEALAAGFAGWRGNRMALATVEMAFWDLYAKWLDLPLKTLLGGEGEAVDVGVSLGIGPIDDTLDRIAAHHAEGYKRIKLKIMPGHDVELIRAARNSFPAIKLSVDANSAYRLSDWPILRELDGYRLEYIEQPLAYDDIHDHAVLQSRLTTPICLDESIRSLGHARRALAADATRVVNIKVGRVGGHAEAIRIHDLCAAFDVPVWCGGMLEAGVGRAHNIHLSTLSNFRKPGDTSSASRYFHHDIIAEKLETTDGRMPVPPGPGIGVTLDRDFLETVTLSVKEIRA
jgi:O-succinylbenzoate synthase